MPALTITPADIAPFADIEAVKLAAMIEDVLATARSVAPCVFKDEFEHPGAAKAILRGAILRWNDAGTGAITTQIAGPFQQTVDTSTRRSMKLWPSEIKELQRLCRGGSSGAWGYDTVPDSGDSHSEICSIRFGARCSCGSWLTNGRGPLWQ